MELLLNVNNFLHFGVSLFLTITITAFIMYISDYKYRTTVYLTIFVHLVAFIGIMKEVYDYIFKTPEQFDTITDLIFNGLGIFIGVIFILIMIKETD
jgi:VanZ family protein